MHRRDWTLRTVPLLVCLIAAVVWQPAGAQPAPQPVQAIVGNCTIGSPSYGFADPDYDIRRGYPDRSVNLRATPGWTATDAFAGTLCLRGANQSLITVYGLAMAKPAGLNYGYRVAAWPSSSPNLRYVNYILHHYYPATSLPVPGRPERSAAVVQAAIWFFTNHYVEWRDLPQDIDGDGIPDFPADGVLDAGDFINGPVAAVVADALRADPPGVAPPIPALAIRGPATGAAGQLIGPFTVDSGSAPVAVTVTVTGAQVFQDDAGTQALPGTFSLPAGSRFFLRPGPGAPARVTVAATGPATVQAGNVFLFTPSDATPGVTGAQELVAATGGQLCECNATSVMITSAPPPPPPPTTTTTRVVAPPPPASPPTTTTPVTTASTPAELLASTGGAANTGGNQALASTGFPVEVPLGLAVLLTAAGLAARTRRATRRR